VLDRYRAEYFQGDADDWLLPASGLAVETRFVGWGAGMVDLEGGYQPKILPALKPWLRGGYYYGSGDGNPNDNRHGTFFQILPTAPRGLAGSWLETLGVNFRIRNS